MVVGVQVRVEMFLQAYTTCHFPCLDHDTWCWIFFFRSKSLEGLGLRRGYCYADKTLNCSSLNLFNFTIVALKSGKDSLRGLLFGSQIPQACGESQTRLRRVKGAGRLPLSCPTTTAHLCHLFIILKTGKDSCGLRPFLTPRSRGSIVLQEEWNLLK